MLLFYKILTFLSSPLLKLLLLWRQSKGKEHPQRRYEREGLPSLARPNTPLIWIHAASVGEAQSALILIEKISHADPDMEFLVTSGTLTSSALMAQRLPRNAVHQFYPLDHPTWVNRFLNHWQPDLVLWMESELWPNMLLSLKDRQIPAILINARLSEKSFKRWQFFKKSATQLLSCFNMILTQTEKDKNYFERLGAQNVLVADNIKYSAAPLPCDKSDLKDLQAATGSRLIWVYASTHDGEEEMAVRLHNDLKEKYENLLTIIVPRHPERRDDIRRKIAPMNSNLVFRGNTKTLPNPQTEIYVADTLGELGLFYTLSPIAMIGRSFSHDGGGGHNPIEAAQLNSAVLTGKNIQYQSQLFEEMFTANAASQLQTEEELLKKLDQLLGDKEKLKEAIEHAYNFAQSKNKIIDHVMERIAPYLPSLKKDNSHAA